MRHPTRVLLAWTWVALCVAVILTFSGDGFSGHQTSRVLGPLLRWLFPEIAPATFLEVHFWVRKSAHLTEYGLLAALAFRALRVTLDVPLARVAGLALGIVLAVAGFDEWRQSFIPSRTGSLGDVAINLAGGGLGVLLVVALHRLFGVGAPVSGEGA